MTCVQKRCWVCRASALMMRPLSHRGVRNRETILTSFSFSPTVCSLSRTPRLGFVEPQLMDGLLVGGHMPMHLSFWLTQQATGFQPAALLGAHRQQPLR